jgi:hypothetical protein
MMVSFGIPIGGTVMQKKWQDFIFELAYKGIREGYEMSVYKNGELVIFDVVPTEKITLIEHYDEDDRSLLAVFGDRFERLYDLKTNSRISGGDWKFDITSLKFKKKKDQLYLISKGPNYECEQAIHLPS